MGEEASAQAVFELPLPMGGNEEGPGMALDKRDLSMDGPGEPGFIALEQKNIFPGEVKKGDKITDQESKYTEKAVRR